MYSVFEIQKPELLYSDSHITLLCVFKDQNGVPIDVINPTFQIYKGEQIDPEKEVTTKVQILKPLQKSPEDLIGHYVVTFLTKELEPGRYLLVCKGYDQNNNEIILQAITDLFEISRTQWLIEMVLSGLKGKYNLLIPNHYLTFDPRKRPWTDGEIYDALIRSLNDINLTPPILDYYFDLETCPATNLLILGGQLYSLIAIDALEGINFFDISTPIHITFYKGDKIRGVYTFIKDMYYTPLREWKQNYWFNTIQERALVMRRVPIRIVRPISDELFFHRLYW